nr:membrane progestin receptor gamma-like [Biomphalaria glabrata]
MLGMSVSTGLSGPIYYAHQVPEHFHEHYILRGYRHPKSSVTQCLLSVFDPTNETLNIWTHFLPTWYFVYVVYHLWWSIDFTNDVYSWPLLSYLLVCCAFPLASAVAHLFNVMSDCARHVCFFLDYSALSLFSFGVALIYRAYCFPSHILSNTTGCTWFKDHYVNLAAITAILCTFISCETRFMKPSAARKAIRLGAFAIPYLFDSIPIFYRILFPDVNEWSAEYLHKRQFFFALVAAFLYASHLPERLLPGIFDIIGHSHQLFHVSSILAVMDQLQAVLLDFKERRSFVEPCWQSREFSNSLGYLLNIFVINSIIIMIFTIRLLYLKHKMKCT